MIVFSAQQLILLKWNLLYLLSVARFFIKVQWLNHFGIRNAETKFIYCEWKIVEEG